MLNFEEKKAIRRDFKGKEIAFKVEKT